MILYIYIDAHWNYKHDNGNDLQWIKVIEREKAGKARMHALYCTIYKWKRRRIKLK